MKHYWSCTPCYLIVYCLLPSLLPRVIFDLAIFSFPEPFYPCYGPEIDLIRNARRLCTPLGTDGIIAISRGFSGDKQVIKFAKARDRGRVCLF